MIMFARGVLKTHHFDPCARLCHALRQEMLFLLALSTGKLGPEFFLCIEIRYQITAAETPAVQNRGSLGGV